MPINGNLLSVLIYKVVALLVGLAFAWMGYRLFLKGITAPAGSAEGGTGKGFTLKLTKVAPGVFFAVMGAIIVVYTVTQILQFRDAGGGVSTLQDTTAAPVTPTNPGSTPTSQDTTPAGGTPVNQDTTPVSPPPVDNGANGGGTILCDTCTAPIRPQMQRRRRPS